MSKKEKSDIHTNHFHIKFTAFGCSGYEIEKIKKTFIEEWNKKQHILNNTLIIAVPEE